MLNGKLQSGDPQINVSRRDGTSALLILSVNCTIVLATVLAKFLLTEQVFRPWLICGHNIMRAECEEILLFCSTVGAAEHLLPAKLRRRTRNLSTCPGFS